HLDFWSRYAQAGSHTALTLIVFGSILIGHPFTESYAREKTPAALWDTPEFHAINRRISAVWGLAFLAGTISRIAAGSTGDRQVLLRIIVPFGALYLAYQYTQKQTKQARSPAPAPTGPVPSGYPSHNVSSELAPAAPPTGAASQAGQNEMSFDNRPDVSPGTTAGEEPGTRELCSLGSPFNVEDIGRNPGVADMRPLLWTRRGPSSMPCFSLRSQQHCGSTASGAVSPSNIHARQGTSLGDAGVGVHVPRVLAAAGSKGARCTRVAA